MIKVAKVSMTCSGCPTVWEGVTDDGKEVYVRFRWGYLGVCVDNQQIYREFIQEEEDSDDNLLLSWTEMMGPEAAVKLMESHKMIRDFSESHGEKMGYAGIMGFDELKKHTGHLIEWPESEQQQFGP